MAQVANNHRGRPCLYPWDEWLTPGSVTLKKGEHFECETKTMEQLIRRQALRRQLIVSVYTKGLSLLVEVRDA